MRLNFSYHEYGSDNGRHVSAVPMERAVVRFVGDATVAQFKSVFERWPSRHSHKRSDSMGIHSFITKRSACCWRRAMEERSSQRLDGWFLVMKSGANATCSSTTSPALENSAGRCAK